MTATKAITTVIGRITMVDALLGEHLRTAVRTGTCCRYEPGAAVPIEWIPDR